MIFASADKAQKPKIPYHFLREKKVGLYRAQPGLARMAVLDWFSAPDLEKQV